MGKDLISECNDFMKASGLTYAFCGGYALELFKKDRIHSDVDITLFNEDGKDIAGYILSKGWDVYSHMHSGNYLVKLTDSNEDILNESVYIWAVKPDCSILKIEPKPGETNVFHFEILNNEQTSFDFIDIIFNTRKDGMFLCDNEKNIGRELNKAILYRDHIPFLAPEVILYIISDPAYIESDYHREKNNIDFASVPPYLSEDSLNWLTASIECAYPNGNHRLAQLNVCSRNDEHMQLFGCP